MVVWWSWGAHILGLLDASSDLAAPPLGARNHSNLNTPGWKLISQNSTWDQYPGALGALVKWLERSYYVTEPHQVPCSNPPRATSTTYCHILPRTTTYYHLFAFYNIYTI
jgi:hypothetical protein